MPCATTIRGEAIPFAIEDDQLGLVTQEVSVTLQADRKEARNSCGNVVSAAYYNRNNDINITGHGTLDAANDNIGDLITLSGTVFDPLLVGSIYIEQIQYRFGNEEFMTVNVKAKAWEFIGTP